MAVGYRIDLDGWQMVFDEVMAGIAGRFGRVEPRRTTRAFVLGLLSGIEKKNSWWLAEHAGLAGPQKMQRLLREAVWDADGVRDDVRDLVVAHLGDPDGVLICDETGFLKKGSTSVAVQRQYTGTAGRIENAQVGVFLAYASPSGRALIDRRIYLPRGGSGPRAVRGSRRAERGGVRDERVWRWTWSVTRSPHGCRPGGSQATRSTAATRHSASVFSSWVWVMSSRSPATIGQDKRHHPDPG